MHPPIAIPFLSYFTLPLCQQRQEITGRQYRKRKKRENTFLQPNLISQQTLYVNRNRIPSSLETSNSQSFERIGRTHWSICSRCTWRFIDIIERLIRTERTTTVIFVAYVVQYVWWPLYTSGYIGAVLCSSSTNETNGARVHRKGKFWAQIQLKRRDFHCEHFPMTNEERKFQLIESQTQNFGKLERTVSIHVSMPIIDNIFVNFKLSTGNDICPRAIAYIQTNLSPSAFASWISWHAQSISW